MAEPSAEVAAPGELAQLRARIDRLESGGSWHTVGILFTMALAGGALALPFVLKRISTNEMVVRELRIVDGDGTTRMQLGWDASTDEAALVLSDAHERRRAALATTGDITVFELLPAASTAYLRAQAAEEDVTVSLRHEPTERSSSWLDLGVHRELVMINAVAGPSTMSSSIASDRVVQHLARSSDGLHVADIELDEHGPSFELRAEKAGRARLHVPAGEVAPEMLVEAPDGAKARLTPALAPAVPPTVPPAPPTK